MVLLPDGRLRDVNKTPLPDDFQFDENTALPSVMWSRLFDNSRLKRKMYELFAEVMVRYLSERPAPLTAIVDPPSDRDGSVPVRIEISGDDPMETRVSIEREPRTNFYAEADLRVQARVVQDCKREMSERGTTSKCSIRTCDYDMMAQMVLTWRPGWDVNIIFSRGDTVVRFLGDVCSVLSVVIFLIGGTLQVVADYMRQFTSTEESAAWHAFLLFEGGSDVSIPLRGFGIRAILENVRDSFFESREGGPVFTKRDANSISLFVNPHGLMCALRNMFWKRSARNRNAEEFHECLVNILWCILYWLLFNPNPVAGIPAGPDPAMNDIRLFRMGSSIPLALTGAASSCEDILVGTVHD